MPADHPDVTGGSGGTSVEICGLSCASVCICTWHTAPVQLARCRPCVRTHRRWQPALTHDRLTGRCRPTDGSEQVDDGSGSANLSTILAGCRGTARVRAVHTALPAWLILLRGLTDACLPARALAAKMGMLWPRATISLVGAPIRLHLLFNTVTWPSGHVPAADSPGLRNAADSPGLPDCCCRRG